MSAVVNLEVHRASLIGATKATESDREVEEPLEILVEGRNLAITMRTPGHDAQGFWSAGFLFHGGAAEVGGADSGDIGNGNQVNLKLERLTDGYDRPSGPPFCRDLRLRGLW